VASDAKGYPVSLTRVSELTGKPIPFVKADVTDAESLEKIFKEVSLTSPWLYKETC